MWLLTSEAGSAPSPSQESRSSLGCLPHWPYFGVLLYRLCTHMCMCRNTRMFMLSCVCLFAIPWTVARQAPLSMGFFRQEYWGRLPPPPPGDLSDPGVKPVSHASPHWQADSLPPSHLESPTYMYAHVKFWTWWELYWIYSFAFLNFCSKNVMPWILSYSLKSS